MPLAAQAYPFGLREVKLKGMAADGTLDASWTALPAGRTLSFTEAEDFEELRGDDKVVASRGAGSVVEFELEGGGISLESYKIMAGGTVTSSGTTPNVVKTYSKKSTDARPYFRMQGRAISDSGGDFSVLMYKCKITGELTGELADSSFWLTGASGTAFADSNNSDKVYDLIHKETEAVIA